MAFNFQGAAVAPFELMAFEMVALPIVLPIEQVAFEAGTVIRFDDQGDVTGTADTVEQLEFVVPYLAGMSDVVVGRASLSVRGERIDQDPVEVAKSSDTATLTLNGRAGGLRRLEIQGMTVDSPTELQLTGSGTPSAYRWEDGDLSKTASSSAHELHLMVRPPDLNDFGPPQTSVPHYDMPDNAAGMYEPILAGASLHLDHPATDTATVTFVPPVDGERVQLFLGTNGKVGAHEGLPHEATSVKWTATKVRGIWASSPSAVTMTAQLDGAEPVMIADFGASALPSAPTAVDFTPGARSLLSQAYAVADQDLTLTITADSATAGDFVATGLTLRAHYRLDSIDATGTPVVLRGTPEAMVVPIADGLRPARLELTIDGSFGPGVRVSDSDEDMPGRRQGLRIAGPTVGARRIALTTEERSRPLIRIAVFGRATEPTELLMSLTRDERGRIGPPLTEPVAIQIDPSLAPTWHRVDIPASPDSTTVDAVWLSGRVSTGTFWWYSDPVPDGSDAAMASADDGSTWSDVAIRPVTQLHYATERPVPSPLELRSPLGLLTPDVLSLPADRTRIETTVLDGLDRGLTVAGPGGAAPITVGSAQPLATDATSVTFRKERLRPVADGLLEQLATIGPELSLTFASARDADFRVRDAIVTYDPWGAK